MTGTLLLLVLLGQTYGGFDDPDKARQILARQMGKPCDCAGGTLSQYPEGMVRHVQSVNCGDKMAYNFIGLGYEPSSNGYSRIGKANSWQCVNAIQTPEPLPPGQLKNCSCLEYQETLHSLCYLKEQAHQCRGPKNKTYWTATQTGHFPGTSGPGTSSPVCPNKAGKEVCWNLKAPIHISDGGGVQDMTRREQVQQKLQEVIDHYFPKVHYHPLALPDRRGRLQLDPATTNLIQLTWNTLNQSSPEWAQDCWICLAVGTPRPLAVPVNLSQPVNTSVDPAACKVTPPLRVQPIEASIGYCLRGQITDNETALDVGVGDFASCTTIQNITTSICAPHPLVFVCGGNLAYTFLPTNWTGTCVLTVLLPDIDLISGKEPVPIPTLDHVAGKKKRAIQMVPLLVGLGLSTSLAAGAAGIGLSQHTYAKLSQQIISDVQHVADTMLEHQGQIDSLAEVVLQNRRGLDLLTAREGGICLFLQERCCFYANRSGTVWTKIKELQDDLEQRCRQLQESPFWTGLNGLLPYLLPFLGPTLLLVMSLTIGPCLLQFIFRRVHEKAQAVTGWAMILTAYTQLNQEDIDLPHNPT
ncbi:syncytin-1-like [Cervus canadensis]|uniref:syncytin-1-like n=1 Tax=Cervus canadensis TaxID=1574408 RepID=UPI001C9E40E3|nr:syncytin-1-like [Cervus canadensis]